MTCGDIEHSTLLQMLQHTTWVDSKGCNTLHGLIANVATYYMGHSKCCKTWHSLIANTAIFCMSWLQMLQLIIYGLIANRAKHTTWAYCKHCNILHGQMLQFMWAYCKQRKTYHMGWAYCKHSMLECKYWNSHGLSATVATYHTVDSKCCNILYGLNTNVEHTWGFVRLIHLMRTTQILREWSMLSRSQ